MPQRNLRYLIPIFLSAILVTGLFLMLPVEETSAQCGSQASSCKSCHETNAADPVNNDGTTWHTQHAQIDACVSCHAGNPQSTDADQSHAGMVAWNSDVKAGCFSCHPDDYMQLAQAYATVLAVTLDDAGSSSGSSSPQPTAVITSTGETAPTGGGMVINQPGTIDFVHQYDETVLGRTSINWGNVILVILTIGMLFGGAVFVFWNERHLRGLKGFYSPKVTHLVDEKTTPVVEGYTSEVTELLPMIAMLNPVGRHSLKRILASPEQANHMLHALSHIDPELIRRVEALDKDSRALLVALAGN